MAREIERKFLVISDAWRRDIAALSGTRIRQGYVASNPGRTVRVRLAGSRGWLAIKGPADPTGVSRDEYEYEIPEADAMALLDRLCSHPLIEKTRYRVPIEGSAGLSFEIDVFEGDNAGLVVAEVELATPEQPFRRPEWLGEEVSADPRYRNSNLAAQPFRSWDEKRR